MIVTWFGGPDDGQTFQVRDGTHWVVIALPLQGTPYKEFESEFPIGIEINTASCEIQTDGHGNYRAIYPKLRSEQ